MGLFGKDISNGTNCEWTKPLLYGHCNSIIKKNYKSILGIRKAIGVYLKKKIITLGNKMPSRFIN